jgi:hypothetical protein
MVTPARNRSIWVLIGGLTTAALTVYGGNGSPAAADSAARGPSPKNFVRRVDNPWFPLTPGTTFVYRGVRDGKQARDVFTVGRVTKTIQGVRCTVVRDRLFLRGKLAERTTDWYAQDRRGNVWYFGESTAELDAAGRVTSTEGSWEAGRDGAVAGIYMAGKPTVGRTYSQEYYKGHAQDHYAAISLHASVHVPYVSSREALLTKEWTPLEPGVIDHKYYVRGIGTVKEVTVKGPLERADLVSVQRR